MIYDSSEIMELENKIKESINILDDINLSLNRDFKILEELEYDGLLSFKNNSNNLSNKQSNLISLLESHDKEMMDLEKEQLRIIDKYIGNNIEVNNYYNGEKVAIDKIVLNKTTPKTILNNYVSEVIPTFSFEKKKEVLKNILNGEDGLTSILTDDAESDIFVYQLNNILKDKYDIKLDKLSKLDEIELQKVFLEKISDNDTNIFSDTKSILSGLSYYKDVAKKNGITLSELIFDKDDLFLESTRNIYENMDSELLTENEKNNFKEYIDELAKNNNILSLDLLNDNKYISLIKGGIYYES